MRVYRDDQKFLQFRINALMWGIAAVFVFLAGSFWFVQGVHADKYRGLAEANSLRELKVPAKRGLIMDRNGKILADNQAAYALVLDRVVMRPIVKRDPQRRQKVVTFVSGVLGVPPQEIEARFERGKTIHVSRPLPLAEDLTMQQMAVIESQAILFPELNVTPVQRRNYANGTMAAHVMGFIGEVNDRDLAQFRDLQQGDLIGKRGVELMYDNYLRGKDGAEYWEYDSHGRRLKEYEPARKIPVAGDNVYLTIDFELQRRAEQYFLENEMVGATVVLDPRNGEVLAMASSPAYDPNVYSKRFTPEVYKIILSNPFKLEVNRAIQGLYSPGSIFKNVMAMAGLSDGAINPSTTFTCGGSGTFFGRRFRCWKREGHGVVNLDRALKISCDIFFYNTGARLGVDKIKHYSEQLTFGKISKIDLDGEKAGLIPSTEWRAKNPVRGDPKWYPSETISVSIGQGPLLVTPLQTANMMAAIANGGKVFRPHVVRVIERIGPDGKAQRLRVADEVLDEVALSPDALAAVRRGLWKVVNEPGGTGANARVEGLGISGKTGTVQVIRQIGWVKSASLPFKHKDHAWFVAYGPSNPGQTPSMVVVVFVEHGGGGGSDAAPLAKLLFESRFRDKVLSARLDLDNPETLEQIREGDLPLPSRAQ
ncbi:MAG TPA: penicillin-binding protein 2 [Thermoanaerobaculia bacterium]|nr:penicillin-binding protein 2 [Thermoanaerobaculia bacterium]